MCMCSDGAFDTRRPVQTMRKLEAMRDAVPHKSSETHLKVFLKPFCFYFYFKNRNCPKRFRRVRRTNARQHAARRRCMRVNTM